MRPDDENDDHNDACWAADVREDEAVERQATMRDRLPRCERCGKPMEVHEVTTDDGRAHAGCAAADVSRCPECGLLTRGNGARTSHMRKHQRDGLSEGVIAE